MPTVRVEPIPDYRESYKLIWEGRVQAEDVPPAFAILNKALAEASAPIYVLVDLTSNPTLPLSVTIEETLRGPFNHPMLAEWLVYGTNWRAQTIANVITKVGLRSNIRWSSSEAEALEYLGSVRPKTVQRDVTPTL
jgi:hypothetical protein